MAAIIKGPTAASPSRVSERRPKNIFPLPAAKVEAGKVSFVSE